MSKTLDDVWTAKGGEVENIVNTTNVVQVDFIKAEYEERDQAGFKKRAPQGYNGSKARLRTQTSNFNRSAAHKSVGDDDYIGSGLLGNDGASRGRFIATAKTPGTKKEGGMVGGGPLSGD